MLTERQNSRVFRGRPGSCSVPSYLVLVIEDGMEAETRPQRPHGPGRLVSRPTSGVTRWSNIAVSSAMIASIVKTIGLQALTETDDLTCKSRAQFTPSTSPRIVADSPPLHQTLWHGWQFGGRE
jgi:hypothetical protein